MTNKEDVSRAPIVLCLGRIQGSKGLDGLVKITSFGDLLASFKDFPISLALYKGSKVLDGIIVQAQIVTEKIFESISNYKNNLLLAKIKGFDQAENSETIKGLYLGMVLDEAKLRFANAESPYLFQYINQAVVDEEDTTIGGMVKHIRQHQNLNWLVVDINNKEILVPLKEPYVKAKGIETPLVISGLRWLVEA